MMRRPNRNHGFSIYPSQESNNYYPFLACCEALKAELEQDYDGQVTEISRSVSNFDGTHIFIKLFVTIKEVERLFLASASVSIDTIIPETLEYGEIVEDDSDQVN